MFCVNATSADPYDGLAPYYREYAAKRAPYLEAVDRFVCDHMPAAANSLLDVGSGDGVRAMSLAKACGIPTVVLSDASTEMADRCRALSPADVWRTPAQELPDKGIRFDTITCLWNVLGHLPDRAERLVALRRMADLLSPAGLLFLDVQNRHNALAYGWWRVFGRVILDGLVPDDRRGDSTFDWHIGGRVLHGRGHLFTPKEIVDLLCDAGLVAVHRAHSITLAA